MLQLLFKVRNFDTQKGCRAMTKKQHYMTENERYMLEAYKNAKKNISWIAREMGFCRQTLYNELKLGEYMHDCGWKSEKRYSAARAQAKHIIAQQNKGRELKIGNDIEYANYLENKILKENYSPAAALVEAKKKKFKTTICITTLYSYIDKRIFLKLTNSDLLEKGHRKKRGTGTKRIAHIGLPSIEQRPEEINMRYEKGHWEMDLIVSVKTSTCALLTLTERVTREEIIMKIPDKRAVTIREALNRLEQQTPNFKEKFKTITTDNGSEFLEYDKLIQSIHGGIRFKIYYCHSYASWEKGTNENHNRMIRQFFPKGTDFAKITDTQVAAVQDWMNNYPRKVLGWKTPLEMAS